MPARHDVLVIGGGIFGVTAALALRGRGHDVAILDPGPLPHPLAASTDISKVVRMEYGADGMYMAMIEEALPGWRRWNEELGKRLFHETGVLMITRGEMAPGGFEYESYHMLLERGHSPQRMDADAIVRRFPAWKPGAFVDGFYHALGGYAESGRVVSALLDKTRRDGVTLYSGQTAEAFSEEGGRVTSLRTREGETFSAGHFVVAAGAWTHVLLPELATVMKASGHPVFHLRPSETTHFSPPDFVVFTADIAGTGWYGFPFHPTEGVIKLANHGAGHTLHPEQDERVVTAGEERRLRRFLSDALPDLAASEIIYTRRCLYGDTLDEHLWIDRHPEKKGLTVAAGGSGHAFKFAPILGSLIADAVEERANPRLARFRWRRLAADTAGEEAARYRG